MTLAFEVEREWNVTSNREINFEEKIKMYKKNKGTRFINKDVMNFDKKFNT